MGRVARARLARVAAQRRWFRAAMHFASVLTAAQGVMRRQRAEWLALGFSPRLWGGA